MNILWLDNELFVRSVKLIVIDYVFEIKFEELKSVFFFRVLNYIYKEKLIKGNLVC